MIVLAVPALLAMALELPKAGADEAGAVLDGLSAKQINGLAAASVIVDLGPDRLPLRCSVTVGKGDQAVVDAICPILMDHRWARGPKVDGKPAHGKARVQISVYPDPRLRDKVPRIDDRAELDLRGMVPAAATEEGDGSRSVLTLVGATGVVTQCGGPGASPQLADKVCQALAEERYPVMLDRNGKPVAYVRAVSVRVTSDTPSAGPESSEEKPR